MKLEPEPHVVNVAVVDGRAGFVVVALEGGGAATVCRTCHAFLGLELGFTDVRLMKHAEDCELGRAIAAAGMPVLLTQRAGVLH